MLCNLLGLLSILLESPLMMEIFIGIYLFFSAILIVELVRLKKLFVIHYPKFYIGVLAVNTIALVLFGTYLIELLGTQNGKQVVADVQGTIVSTKPTTNSAVPFEFE